MQLSRLLGRPLLATDGGAVGKVDDVVVGLRGKDAPVVRGLVAKVGGRRVFVPVGRLDDLGRPEIALAKPKLDLRTFERRDGEVLLREDVLGHRLIDVADVALVRAWDVELERGPEGWLVAWLDTRRPARLFGLLPVGPGRARREWGAFEPLIGHEPSARWRSGFGRLGRLKPAQIADLLEDASRTEGEEILEQVHTDPELEADVFEELEPDTATRFFGDKSDAEVAEILGHMRADDAADAVAELPQARRRPVLDLLAPPVRTKVMTLLGFSSSSAGGLMGVDFLTAPPQTTVDDALRRVRLAQSVQPEALVTVHAVDDGGHLVGTVDVIRLLHAEPDALLDDIIDHDPVRVAPGADVVDVALLMADYNLMTVPVVDADDLLVGVITVDDVLEATIPDDWRRREPPAAPEPEPEPEATPDEVQANGLSG